MASPVQAEIRRADTADIALLEHLASEASRELNSPLMNRTELEAYVRSAAHFDPLVVHDGTYFVAEKDGEIVGGGGWSVRRALFAFKGRQMGLYDIARTDPCVEAGRLRGFFVCAAHARRGIGRSLVAACERDARRAGYRRLELVATPSGEPLYRSCGFVHAGNVELVTAEGICFTPARMTKAI